MGVTLILAPVVIGSWPAISAAVAGAAASMGLVAARDVKDVLASEKEELKECAEIEVGQNDVVQGLSTQEQIVLNRGDVQLKIKRDVRGKCTVTAEAKGKSKAELTQIAEEFSQKVTQCFTYNKVVTQLKSKGFSMVNEEVMSDNGIRIHVRQAE